MSIVSKRRVLSDCTLFDPLRFLGPVVILEKIFIQQLWKLNMSWDDELKLEFKERWAKYRSQLEELKHFQLIQEEI